MKKKKRNKIYVLVGVASLFIGLHSFFTYQKSEIKSNGVYTVAKITGYYSALSSSPEIYFTYYVEGQKLRIPTKFDGDYSLIEDKFFKVRYATEHPSWGEIQLNYPVTDTAKIKEAGFSIPKPKRNQFRD